MAGLKKAKGIGKATNKSIQDILASRHMGRTLTARNNVNVAMQTLKSNEKWLNNLFKNPPKVRAQAFSGEAPIDMLTELKGRYGVLHKAYTQARNKVLKGVGAGAAGLTTVGGLGYGVSRWNNDDEA